MTSVRSGGYTPLFSSCPREIFDLPKDPADLLLLWVGQTNRIACKLQKL